MTKPNAVGVVVGRFQVHKLHEGHIGLINHALALSDRVIIFVGNSPLKNSTANPLDFRSREQMLRSTFWAQRDRLTILYINDTGDNESWASDLDNQIATHTTPAELSSVILFGGRDSFVPHYEDGNGMYDSMYFDEVVEVPGTDIRKQIATSDARDSEDWRAALIYASQDRFPTSYQCVDVAVLRKMSARDNEWNEVMRTDILLGRKKHDKLLRFFGGFVDPSDASLEAAVRREVAEEAGGISVDSPRYVGSANVEDWRYAREPDGIKTALFTVTYQWGKPEPTDDLAGGEVKWVPIADLKPTIIVPQHRHLLDLLLTKGL